MPIDYQTDYYPTGEDLKDIRKPSTTYDNSNLTVGQERTRQLENAGLTRSPNGKAVDPQRNINAATTQSRIGFNASKLLNKASGVEQFNPYATPQAKPIAQQTKPVAQSVTSWDELDKMSSVNLKYRSLTGNQDIDFTKRKIREVDTIANNEANRAYGMKLDNDNRAMGVQLATQFPYKKYETETNAARESMSDTLRTMPSFLNRNTAVKPQQYVSF
jgi:hypothetical protein